MELKSGMKYLNTMDDTYEGLLIETLPGGRIVGASVKYEVTEMHSLLINGMYYQITGWEDCRMAVLKPIDDILAMEDLITELYGDRGVSPDEWNPEVSCPGFLMDLMRRSADPRQAMRDFLEDFCAGSEMCEDEVGCQCDFYRKVKEYLEEVSK